MKTDLPTHPLVKLAVEALSKGDSKAWFDLFTADAELFDDGNKMDFHSFFKKAIGHERFVSIDKVENEGLTVYGRFHSDQWGDFQTYFKFHLRDNRFYKLEIGQASY